jgi:hypothetical protein
LTQLGRTITQALRGPDWGRVFEHKSAHYHVLSNIDRITCKRAAKLLEDAYRAYNVHLARVKKTGERLKVYLFAGRAGYRAYSEATLGDKDAKEAGCYSPWLRQLLIWNSPERHFMMQVVRHEGSHQFVHAALGYVPAWFDEGLAEYHETAEYRNGSWMIGKVRPDHLRHLDPEEKILRLSVFTRMDDRRFYRKNARRNYAQAWAFMHFIRHGPRKYRPIFEEIIDGLTHKEPAGVVTKRVLGRFDLAAMDTAFRTYVKELAEER